MADNAQKPVLIVCGPTASGKSALALDAAEAFGGVVINADSMQVYRELRVLTARPSEDDEARVAHRLYGIASVRDVFSAGRWRALAVREIDTAHAAGQLPIVCGGTGFYLKALMEGLSPMPEIPETVRRRVRDEAGALGAPAVHAALARVDPETAAQIKPGDSQRVTRALEIHEATGRPLAEWQAEARIAPDPTWSFGIVLLSPKREVTNAAVDERFRAMIEAGALDEIASLDGLDGELPALKAVGVPHLRRHLRGEIDLETAVARAQTATRQFAKRQTTWFKNQIIADITIKKQYSESLCHKIFSFIREKMLTQSY